MARSSVSPVAGYPSYQAYLESPEWSQRRAGILRRDHYRCACGQRATQVHHATYARIGHEANADLISVCDSCHVRIHFAGKKARRSKKRLTKRQQLEAAAGIRRLRLPSRTPLADKKAS